MKKNLIALSIQAAVLSSSVVLMSDVFAVDEQVIEKNALNQNDSTNTEVKNSAQEKHVEKITVTGSRIKRDSFSVATPLVTMDKDAIEDTGLGSLSEILIAELPQVSEGSSNTNSQSSVQNTGLSTIDLRDLGTNRTLTLVDGRRVVSNSYSGNYVSLSTIPTSMVERVEVISGGASAAYGSDAIAGVVNIITQQGKTGGSFQARSGESDEGGAQEYSLDFDYGNNFNDDKGYVFFAASYDKEKGLTYYDRNRAQQQNSWGYDDDLMCNTMLTEAGRQCMRDISKADWRNLSDSIPGGVFDEKSSTRPDAGFWYDANGLRDDWHEERYGIDFNQYEQLKVPDEKINAAIKVDYSFDNDIEAYGQVQYSINNSRNYKSPESEDECDDVVTFDPASDVFGTACIGRIPKNNPYVPAEIYAQASSRGVTWDRNFSEVGDIITDNKRTTMRSWGGLRGTAFNDNWDWDLSVGYGKFKQEQHRFNEIDVIRAANALNAEYAADGVTIQCAEAAARAEGCAPLNLFGEGAISPEAADYIRSNPTITTDITQTSVLGYIAGDLFQMPAGPVGTAFGFEYRKDEQEVSAGGGAETGGISFNYVPTFKGDVSVTEVFGEAAIPLLKDVAGAKSLSAEVSARFADYDWSGTGLVESYKVGFIWEPLEGYAVRANWARAQRAPTITELMSPPRGDYDSYTDICEDTTATSTNPGHDNCRKDPGIAATIAADGIFDGENNSYSPNAGNENLHEETADTYTVGITMSPAMLKNFQIALDYYDIQIKDAMSSYANEDILKFCYDSSLAYGNENQYCNDVTRNTEGNIEEVMQREYNLDEIRTKGYDIAMAYQYDLGEYGTLKFKADMTHVIEWSTTATSPDGLFTTYSEGYLSTGIFEDKASASIAWYNEGWRVRWSTKFLSDVTVSESDQNSWESAMLANDELCAAQDADCITNPESLAFNSTGSYVRHDLSVSYSMDLNNDDEIRFFGGVNNIFDDRGPFIEGGTGNYDSAYGGGVGRYLFVGAEFSF